VREEHRHVATSTRRALSITALACAFALTAGATDKMEKQARKLGFDVPNCHYCHATDEAVKVMKQRAAQVGVSAGNCGVCHGKKLPATLNSRGRFLVSEKKRREATEFDMAWLKGYAPPAEPENQPQH
jgi:hypothetical protein